MSETRRIFTIGHSNRSLEEFIGLLKTNGVKHVVDVRTVPRSRHNPQFNKEALPASLEEEGVGYSHMAGLGGWRKTRPNSPNTGWSNAGFQGYADYMLTPEFEASLEPLIALASTEQAALMCAEAVPWRCHRQLLSDAVTVRGVIVEHITGPGPRALHTLTPFAKIEGTRLTYPSSDEQLSLGL